MVTFKTGDITNSVWYFNKLAVIGMHTFESTGDFEPRATLALFVSYPGGTLEWYAAYNTIEQRNSKLAELKQLLGLYESSNDI